MRPITQIILHCSATPAGSTLHPPRHRPLASTTRLEWLWISLHHPTRRHHPTRPPIRDTGSPLHGTQCPLNRHLLYRRLGCSRQPIRYKNSRATKHALESNTITKKTLPESHHPRAQRICPKILPLLRCPKRVPIH